MTLLKITKRPRKKDFALPRIPPHNRGYFHLRPWTTIVRFHGGIRRVYKYNGHIKVDSIRSQKSTMWDKTLLNDTKWLCKAYSKVIDFLDSPVVYFGIEKGRLDNQGGWNHWTSDRNYCRSGIVRLKKSERWIQEVMTLWYLDEMRENYILDSNSSCKHSI